MKRLTTILSVLFFSLPSLLWLPVFADPADTTKNYFLIYTALVLLALWLLCLARSKYQLTIKSPFLLPILLLLASLALSTFFAPNHFESILSPLGLGTLTALSLIYFLLTSPSQTDESPLQAAATPLALLLSCLIAGGLSVLSYFVKLPFATQPLFLAGTPIATAEVLLASLIGLSAFLWFSRTNHEKRAVIFNGLIPLLITSLIIFGIFLWKAQPLNQSLAFLPYPAGWQVALNAIAATPFWGVGPTNFLVAFTTGRPPSLNPDQNLWNFRFFVNSNVPLHLLATTGLFGLLSYLLFIFLIIKSLFLNHPPTSPLGKTITITLTIIILLQLIFPPTLVTWWLFFALLILYVKEVKHSPPSSEFTSRLPLKAITTAALSLLLIFTGYLATRALIAETTYKSALDAITKNDGVGAYNSLIRAVDLNPTMETYHLTYSQVNLALASSIAAKGSSGATKEGSPSGTLSDQDRNTITQLVQQSIREGKAAVSLNPNLVTNWENLASLYRNLLAFAQGADQWAVAAQKQAVILDPTNPAERLQLGQLYYSLGDYDNALLFFQQAADFKPDFANAHYNLAATYREKKNYHLAASEMQKVLDFTPKSSSDYSRIQGELTLIQKAVQNPIPPSPTPLP